MRSRDTSTTGKPRRNPRRGSALIVTVGTLALIAVFAAFYVTLGQADTRVAAVVEHKSELAGVETQIAEHIARVIADDRVASTVETITNDEDEVGIGYDESGVPISPNPDRADRQRFVREATDYPYTDFSYKSVFSSGLIPGEEDIEFEPGRYGNTPGVFDTDPVRLSAAIGRLRFSPAGDHGVMLNLPSDNFDLDNPAFDALRDYRVASDPFLAASEPTFTGTGDPDINHATFPAERRVFSEYGRSLADVGDYQDEFHYLDNRDWRQISNLAPDGLSVNLFNLRGRFEAQPGLGRDLDGWRRMSENRTLLTLNDPRSPNPTPEQLRIRATDRLHIDPDGSHVDSFLDETDTTAFAVRNTPAWWTMNQRFLYFPADPSFQILGRADADPGTTIDNSLGSLVPQTWATPDFPDYQYADTDGDGFYDARWFELTDSTLGFLGSTDLLQHETDMRFFIAARVVDLSGRVNVNSATDSMVPATSGVPAGATPSEIDLRRLFTMQEPSGRYRPVFENPDSNPPNLRWQRLSLAHIEPLPFAERQNHPANSGRLVAADYSSYITAQAPNTPFLGFHGVNTGRYAYDALRREIQGNQVTLSSSATNVRASGVSDVLRDSTPFEYFNFRPNVQDTIDINALPRQQSVPKLAAMPRWRRDYWHLVGGANIADPGDAPLTALGLGGRLFDLEDLAELLSFNGLNDDTRTSRLERVTQGRNEADNSTDFAASWLRFGPLRANRPTELERRGHDNQDNRFSAFMNPSAVGDHQIDFESMALSALDVRRRLTTVSGAAPLRSRVIEDTNGDGVLSDAERRLTAEDARLDLVRDAGDPAKLFALYTDALAPFARADATWNADPEGETTTQPAYRRARTLAYGHRGSELALRISSHLAVNMADTYDEDDVPSAYTVVASPRNTVRANLDTNFPGTLREDDPFPWWVEGNRLDLGDEHLAPLDDDVNGDYSRIAYNVFGLEPQPFITEVAVVTVYTDTPQDALVPDIATNGFAGVVFSGDEDPGQRPGNNERRFGPVPQGQTPGDDEDTDDDVDIRTEISPENPDLVTHVLAIQLTNPFDVPINLSGDDAEVQNDGGALNSVTPQRIEDVKFYLEFNGHFFPLAEYFERDPDINPATGIDTGGPRLPNRLYGVTLEPGESRVFYVSAHPWVEGMNQRWKAIDKVYPPTKDVPNGVFYDVLNDMTNRNPFEEFIAAQFTVTDENGRPMHRDELNVAHGPVRMIPFDPRNGQLARAGFAWDPGGFGGTFVDFLRTSVAVRNHVTDEAHDRMRQEVRLWRKMSVEDSAPFNAGQGEDNDFINGNTHPTGVSSAINWLENDLLLDRMRDPVLPRQYTPNEVRSTLDYATFDPTQVSGRAAIDLYANWNDFLAPTGTISTSWSAQNSVPIRNTTATGSVTPGSNTSQGLTFTRFAGYRRPDHLSLDTATSQLDPVLNGDDLALRGLLPAWCVESVDTNHNIITPIDLALDRDSSDDGVFDEPATSLAALTDINDFHNDDQRFDGLLYGFTGEAGSNTGLPENDNDNPPYFAKMFRGMMTDTVPAFELDAATLLYTVPDLAIIPTMRRHPALKSERGLIDPLGFSTVMSTVGIPGNLAMTDAATPYLMGADDAATVTNPSVMDDRQALLVNNSDRFGYDGEDPRTSGIRLGDLLMPLGVGATYAPKLHNPAGEPWPLSAPELFRPSEWTTVAEALSAALGLEPAVYYNRDVNDVGYSLLCELVERKGTFNAPTDYDGTGGNTLFVGTPRNHVEFVLSKGRLNLNAYTPFYNRSFDYPGGGNESLSAVFYAGEPGTGDRRVGDAVPPAQRLLSMAQALTRGGDPLTTPIIGTVNINTAPDAVLTTIPGFSTPLQASLNWVDYDKYDVASEGVFSPITGPNQMEWAPGRVAGKTLGAYRDYTNFGQQTPERPLPFGIGDPFSVINPWQHRADIAPALSAFRDRAAGSFSLNSVNPLAYANGFNQLGAQRPREVFDFNPSYDVLDTAFGLTVSTPALPDERSLFAQNYALDMSRSAINGQFGASERPGLTGAGDLLGLSIYKRDPLSLVEGPNIVNPRFTGGIGANSWGQSIRDQANQATLTRHAWDDLAMAAQDQDFNGDADPNGDGTEQILFDNDPFNDDNFSYTFGRGMFLNENPDEDDRRRVLEDELADDILEELAIFNGAANTIDTRSDFFAAWFIVRGYRESDVEGLDDAEPMTPSYQKRFMMVIDRSNVTDAGQMPRILLLREVPL